MSLKNKVVNGVVWSAIENFGRQAISFVVFFILARLLGPEAFGLVALAGIYIAFLQVFVDQGLSPAIIQRHDLEPEHLNAAFWSSIGLSSTLAIVSFLCAGLVSNFFDQPAIAPIIRYLSLNFFLSGFKGVQQALFERNLNFRPLALRSLVAVAVGGLVGVTMAYQGWGAWSLVGQQLVGSLAEVIILWSASDWRPGFCVSFRHYKELFSFGIYDLGFRVFDFFSRRGDDLLIGYFLGPVPLGYYTVAYKILTLMTQLLTSTTNKVALPTFSRLQTEPERMRQALYKATQFSSLVAFPAFLYVSALSPELINVIFGSQWTPSIPVMQILALVGILQSVSFFTTSVIVAMGKPDWRLILIVLYSITNVIAFALVLRWGITAVATAYVVRAYLFSPLPVWMIYKLIKIDVFVYLRQFIVPLLSSFVMVACILISRHILQNLVDPKFIIGFSALMSPVVYISLIYFLSPKLFQQIVELSRFVMPSFRNRGG